MIGSKVTYKLRQSSLPEEQKGVNNSVYVFLEEIRKNSPETINLITKIINTIQYKLVDKSLSLLHLDYFETELNLNVKSKIDIRTFIENIKHFATHRIGGFFNYFSPGGVNRTTSIDNILRELHGKDTEDISREIYSELELAAGVFQNVQAFENPKPPIAVEDDINSQDNDGRTILHHAAEKGAFATKWNDQLLANVEFVKAGANPNIQDKDGRTPLHIAIINKNILMSQFLIDYGANLDIQDKDGRTPLHLNAVLFPQRYECEILPEICRELVLAGASLNIQDKDGRTPLHCTTKEGYGNNCRQLIEAGAAVDVIDKDGRTPLHYAVEREYLNSIWKQNDVDHGIDEYGNQVDITDYVKRVKRVMKESCQALVLAGASLNIEDQEGITPMDLISANGSELRHQMRQWHKESLKTSAVILANSSTEILDGPIVPGDIIKIIMEHAQE
jgi:ankyrin repeat protein